MSLVVKVVEVMKCMKTVTKVVKCMKTLTKVGDEVEVVGRGRLFHSQPLARLYDPCRP